MACCCLKYEKICEYAAKTLPQNSHCSYSNPQEALHREDDCIGGVCIHRSTCQDLPTPEQVAAQVESVGNNNGSCDSELMTTLQYLNLIRYNLNFFKNALEDEDIL